MVNFKYEEELNHPGQGLTGFDLIESVHYDSIIMIRCIEQNKKELKKDANIICFKPDKFMLKYIYKEYCSTVIDLDNINMVYFKKAIDLVFLEDD